MIRRLLFLVCFVAQAEEPWWTREPLRIIDVSSSLTNKLDLTDPASTASAKSRLGFNMEHLDVMQIAGGLDDDHFYFVSKVAGKVNPDYLKAYLPEAHKRGIRTLIYFDVHWYSKRFAERHPDWRQIRESGAPLDGVYDTGADFCLNSPWREWVFQVLRDLAAYPIDGIFYDGPVFRPDTCYCKYCREKFRRTYEREMPSKAARRGPEFASLVEFQARSMAEFLHDSRKLLKDINPNLAFYMNGGARGANWATGRLNRVIQTEQDILGSEGGFLAGDLTHVPLWKPSFTARLLETQSPKKPRVIFSAAGQKPWSFSLLPAAELRLLYASTIANAANIWFGVTPFDTDQPEMMALAEMNGFLARNHDYFADTRSGARVALVWSDTTANFYAGAGAQLMDIDTVKTASDVGNLDNEFTGIGEALMREHLPFDVIDDVSLEREDLAHYDAIFLPNVACMSDKTAARLREYVEEGGNLFATFETSLYDETGIHRKDFALAGVFGAGSDGKVAGPMRWDFMKPSAASTLLDGLNRNLVASAIYHVRARVQDSQAVLFFTKPLAGRYDGLPEVSTDPALLTRRFGKGMSAYFSGDLGASIIGFHVAELLQLVGNAARDMSRRPVTVEHAPGSVEVVLRTQNEGRRQLVHLVNFTGEMTRPIRAVVPVRDVAITLPGEYGRAYALYHPEQKIRIVNTTTGDSRVVLPRLDEYEVVVLER